METLFNSVNGTTGCYPGDRFMEAVDKLANDTYEPLIGKVKIDNCQLCPQNYGVLRESLVDELKTKYPDTLFRLHANVRIEGFQRSGCNLSDFEKNPEADNYFKALADINRKLCRQPYILHPGESCNIRELHDNAKRVMDHFECPVGVEGMYPGYAISRWSDYREMMEIGMYYAVDLSHLNIVARSERKKDDGLLKALLSSENCLEIHISGNDGKRDNHHVLEDEPWWFDVLMEANISNAVIFTEGNQKYQLKH